MSERSFIFPDAAFTGFLVRNEQDMKKMIVIIGIGELGELFAYSFLKAGYPVYPVLRGMSLAAVAAEIPEPELVLLAVGENELHPELEALPECWHNRLALLQNELLPRDWQRHGLIDPTVIVVWFDKKKGRPFTSLLPSYTAGPKATLITQVLRLIEVPCCEINSENLLYELVRKYLYILMVNIGGLRMSPGSTVHELWNDHRDLAETLVNELIDIQEWLVQSQLPRDKLMTGMLEAFDADPKHICRGRTATERLHRILDHASQAGIKAPLLEDIAKGISTQD
jgi:hypothetical protein